jgi:hypothetical protein
MIEQGVTMTKVAVVATVWLHLIVIGALVEIESIRIWKLPAPRIEAAAQQVPMAEPGEAPAGTWSPCGVTPLRAPGR